MISPDPRDTSQFIEQQPYQKRHLSYEQFEKLAEEIQQRQTSPLFLGECGLQRMDWVLNPSCSPKTMCMDVQVAQAQDVPERPTTLKVQVVRTQDNPVHMNF
ncbi:MAG: hypothetical protein OEZ58_01405 [Gammaproteobacteria bacterium]|nr:hypothetical protein [Gammaproteobacteria bacterium]